MEAAEEAQDRGAIYDLTVYVDFTNRGRIARWYGTISGLLFWVWNYIGDCCDCVHHLYVLCIICCNCYLIRPASREFHY